MQSRLSWQGIYSDLGAALQSRRRGAYSSKQDYQIGWEPPGQAVLARHASGQAMRLHASVEQQAAVTFNSLRAARRNWRRCMPFGCPVPTALNGGAAERQAERRRRGGGAALPAEGSVVDP